MKREGIIAALERYFAGISQEDAIEQMVSGRGPDPYLCGACQEEELADGAHPVTAGDENDPDADGGSGLTWVGPLCWSALQPLPAKWHTFDPTTEKKRGKKNLTGKRASRPARGAG